MNLKKRILEVQRNDFRSRSATDAPTLERTSELCFGKARRPASWNFPTYRLNDVLLVQLTFLVRCSKLFSNRII